MDLACELFEPSGIKLSINNFAIPEMLCTRKLSSFEFVISNVIRKPEL